MGSPSALTDLCLKNSFLQRVQRFLDYKESWVPKNWCSWTVVLEKTLESPLDLEIQPVNPKGNQSWIFIGRTDAKAETPVLWPPHAKSWLTGKDSGAGRDWGQEEKGTTEDEMAGWHHRLDGREFEWTQSWWLTGRPGMLQFMGSQRVRHDWATELNWSRWFNISIVYFHICKMGPKWLLPNRNAKKINF